MNDVRGKALASKLGKVEKMDVDDKGRAWGDFLCVRVSVDVNLPLMRCVSVFPQKRNTIDVYQVKYERLPLFCFSCGCVGHSSVLCPSPGERDAEGLLPYHSSRLCVQDDRKKMPVGAKSSRNSSSKHNATGSHGGAHASVNRQHGVRANDSVGEGIPPPKPRKPRATRAKKVASTDVNMRRSDGSAGDVCAGSLATSSGHKRKEYQPMCRCSRMCRTLLLCL
ncbi:hypothetical protein D1007_12255 [Hordeum vulgare]|nr:hypothetical protein D1007_12255 [Hordeum vulgare]